MVIDTHVHIRVPEADSAETSLNKGIEWFARVLEVAEAAGVDKLCVIGEPTRRVPRRVLEERGGNAMLLRLLEEYPDKLFGYARINPNEPDDAIRQMERCFENKRVIGVKVGGGRGPESLKANAPEYEPIMKRLGELNGIMLMHAWHKTTGNNEQESTPFEVAEMGRRFPGVKIQMAHLTGANYDGILAIAPYRNIFVDSSGGFPEAGFIEWAVEVLGPDRIVFGSDIIGRDFSVQLAKITGSDLEQDVKSRILGRNMIDILGDKF